MLTERREVISVVLLLLSLSSSLPSIVTNVSNYTVLTSLEVIHHALHGLTSREVMYILRSHINMMTKATFILSRSRSSRSNRSHKWCKWWRWSWGWSCSSHFSYILFTLQAFSALSSLAKHMLTSSICLQSHNAYSFGIRDDHMETRISFLVITHWLLYEPAKNTSLSSSQLHCSSPKTWLGIEVFDSFYQKEKHSLSNLNLQICSWWFHLHQECHAIRTSRRDVCQTLFSSMSA